TSAARFESTRGRILAKPLNFLEETRTMPTLVPYRTRHAVLGALACLAVLTPVRALRAQETRARARALGVKPGIFQPGPLDGITDVHGVLVGQVTITHGDSVHTGVTAILPHAGNMFFDRVPAAVYVGNAFG